MKCYQKLVQWTKEVYTIIHIMHKSCWYANCIIIVSDLSFAHKDCMVLCKIMYSQLMNVEWLQDTTTCHTVDKSAPWSIYGLQ